MTDLGWSAYLAIFAGTTALTLLFVPLMMRLAIRYDILDHPGGDHSYKAQKSATPYLGGLAIVVSFSAAVMLAAALRPPVTGLLELTTILAGGLVLSLLGLLDDLRGLSPWLRLAVMTAVAMTLFAVGVRVQLLDSTALDAVLTVVWIVGITNALNLLDNMDGLSAGVTVVASVSFFLVAAVNGQFLVAALSVALAGCALGFLRSNFHPARIYMGDAGSLFLGLILAVIGVKLRFAAPRDITAFVPILVLGVAIFDTGLVVTTRMLHGRSPLRGGRDHVSHRLAFVGIPVRGAVGLVYAGGVSLGWLAVIMSRLRDQGTAYLLIGFVVVVAGFLAILLAQVPVYENSRRRRVMLQRVDPPESEPPQGVSPTPGGMAARGGDRRSDNVPLTVRERR